MIHSISGLPVPRQHHMGSCDCLAALPLGNARPEVQFVCGTVQVGSHQSLLTSCSSRLWTRLWPRVRLPPCRADLDLPGEDLALFPACQHQTLAAAIHSGLKHLNAA